MTKRPRWLSRDPSKSDTKHLGTCIEYIRKPGGGGLTKCLHKWPFYSNNYVILCTRRRVQKWPELGFIKNEWSLLQMQLMAQMKVASLLMNNAFL